MRRDHEPSVNVPCTICGDWFESMTGLRYHLKREHPRLGTRDRSLVRDLARREAGWWGVRP